MRLIEIDWNDLWKVIVTMFNKKLITHFSQSKPMNEDLRNAYDAIHIWQ